MEKNVASLNLADEIGANCCVNISGARGEIWDGPYPGKYEKETFDMIVAAVRRIIDEVRPLRSFIRLNQCLICCLIHPTPISVLLKPSTESNSGRISIQSI